MVDKQIQESNIAIDTTPKFISTDIGILYRSLSKKERYFISLYIETLDEVYSVKQAFDIVDDTAARIKFSQLSKKPSIDNALEKLLEDAMGPKKTKFNIFKLSRTSFDPMVKFKSLELLARINNMIDNEHQTNVNIDLGSMLKASYEKMKSAQVVDVTPEVIDVPATDA